MKFRAAVLNRIGEPLALDTLEMRALQPHDVLVRVKAAGLCHTDLEVMQGSLRYPTPIVLGHEGAGVVEDVGASVARVKRGDRVVLSWNPHCGHCFYCERGLPILCEPFKQTEPKGHLLDGASRMTRNGEKVHHFFTTSAFGECTVVTESSAIPVPAEIPFDRACIIGCGVMTGIGAVVRKARVAAGSSVAVIGCGAVGLNAIQGARLVNAGRVIAVDRSPERLALAERLGASDTIDASDADVDVAARIRDLTAGRGADYVFEAAGSKGAFRLAVEAVRPGGEVVWLGKIDVDQEVTFRWGTLMGEKRIVRSSYGDARPARDFPWIAREYLAGRVKLDELITRRIRLDEINDGFAVMARGEGIRSVIEFD
jgi:S-(hydroxymethyl)glutathione dehydrogenase/alcohol dehydrogenase